MTKHDEIIDRLSNIHIDVNAMKMSHEALSEKVDDMKTDLHKIEKSINGNGEVGFKIRIDRIEQSGKLLKWFGGIVFTTLVGWGIYELL